jgi:hypothetical protein
MILVEYLSSITMIRIQAGRRLRNLAKFHSPEHCAAFRTCPKQCVLLRRSTALKGRTAYDVPPPTAILCNLFIVVNALFVFKSSSREKMTWLQSKLQPTGRSLKAIVSDLTPLYLKHRTSISRRVYVTLLAALIHCVHNAVLEQKAPIWRQVEIREKSGPRTAKYATDAEAQCDVRVETDHVERGMVIFIGSCESSEDAWRTAQRVLGCHFTNIETAGKKRAARRSWLGTLRTSLDTMHAVVYAACLPQKFLFGP